MKHHFLPCGLFIIFLLIYYIEHPAQTAAQLMTSQSNTTIINTATDTTVQEQEEDDTYVIVLDPGHGGYDSGCISEDGLYEKDIALSLALQTGAILEENGIQVVYTRTSDEVTWPEDVRLDLRARVSIAEEAEADYYISFHLNSSDYNDGAQGYEIYLDYEDDTIINMASTILDAFDQLQYSQNRGLKSTDDSTLYVIDYNEVPAMLIEFGFFSDREDTAYIASTSGQAALAQAVAESILSTLDV